MPTSSVGTLMPCEMRLVCLPLTTPSDGPAPSHPVPAMMAYAVYSVHASVWGRRAKPV